MAKGKPKESLDFNQIAKLIVDFATEDPRDNSTSKRPKRQTKDNKKKKLRKSK